MQNMRVATVQFQHRPGDKAANLKIIRRFVEQAAQRQVELIAFPECCLSGYWHLRNLERMELIAVAEEVPDGPSIQSLLKLASQHQITIGVGLVESDQDRLFNSYAMVMPDGRVECHRKLHCFISPHLDSGDRFTVFDLPNGNRVGVLICYDNNLVENARICALLGADVLVAPHQTGGCKSGSPFAMGTIDVALWANRHEDPAAIEAEFRGDKGRGWLMRWLPARAHDNGLFLIFSNGVGQDDNEVRTGNAMVLDPYGRIITETWAPRDEMLVADLDASLRERSTGARWLKARRPELYGLLTQVTGLEEPTRKVRFEYDADS